MIGRTAKRLGMGGMGRVKVYLVAMWKLFRHPRTPRAAKWVAGAVLAYALSPIDLIPDFIPVLGMLDDLILVPLGIALVVKLTPAPLWQEVVREAELTSARLPKLWWGALLIVAIWVVLIALIGWAIWRAMSLSA